jgi:hypothetical protein
VQKLESLAELMGVELPRPAKTGRQMAETLLKAFNSPESPVRPLAFPADVKSGILQLTSDFRYPSGLLIW